MLPFTMFVGVVIFDSDLLTLTFCVYPSLKIISMTKGKRISSGRFQLDAANGCNGKDEQLFKIPYFDEDNNEFWDDLD